MQVKSMDLASRDDRDRTVHRTWRTSSTENGGENKVHWKPWKSTKIPGAHCKNTHDHRLSQTFVEFDFTKTLRLAAHLIKTAPSSMYLHVEWNGCENQPCFPFGLSGCFPCFRSKWHDFITLPGNKRKHLPKGVKSPILEAGSSSNHLFSGARYQVSGGRIGPSDPLSLRNTTTGPIENSTWDGGFSDKRRLWNVCENQMTSLKHKMCLTTILISSYLQLPFTSSWDILERIIPFNHVFNFNMPGPQWDGSASQVTSLVLSGKDQYPRTAKCCA